MRCFAQLSIGSVKNRARQLVNVLPQYTSTTLASACSYSPCCGWQAEGCTSASTRSLPCSMYWLAKERGSVLLIEWSYGRIGRPGPCRWEW